MYIYTYTTACTALLFAEQCFILLSRLVFFLVRYFVFGIVHLHISATIDQKSEAELQQAIAESMKTAQPAPQQGKGAFSRNHGVGGNISAEDQEISR